MLISDVVLLDYKRCPRRPFLDFYGDATQQQAQGEIVSKLREENHQQILDFLADTVYHEPQAPLADWQARGRETLELMEQGVDCILNGILWQRGVAGWNLSFSEPITFIANPALLVKTSGSSIFGDWEYQSVSIKLGRQPKPEYKIVAAFQAYLLSLIQQSRLNHPRVIVRSHREYRGNFNPWMSKMKTTLTEVLTMLRSRQEPEVFISRQRCNLCQWQQFCYDIAKQQQHLSLLPGVTPSRYETLQQLGLVSLEDLANCDPAVLAPEMDKQVAVGLKQQAIATLHETPLLKSTTPGQILETIPSAVREIYFDIEAEPERNLDYLLGVLIVDYSQQKEQFYPFLAESPEQEAEVWEQFLSLVNADPQAPIFHYSKYEVDTIKRLTSRYQTSKQQEQLVLKRLVDLHDCVTKSLIFPTENYSLKKIAQWLGFQWREANFSGEQCVYWYDQWLKTRDRTLLDTIIRYNEDDCRATYHLKTWLVNFLSSCYDSSQKTISI